MCNSTLAARPDLVDKPVYMKADKVEYDQNRQIIIATGNIFIEFEGYFLKSDYIYYDINSDHLVAEGNIRVEDDQRRVVIGNKAIFTDKLKQGIIDEFILKIGDSYLMARKAKRIDESRASLYKATFTPCDIHCGKEPIWKVSAEDAFVDFEKNKMIYSNVFFQIYGVPVAYLPYFAHPTPQAPGQTGLLLPEMKQGALLIPFYFRVSDNMDATISPRVGSGYTIFEFEARHKLKEGDYKITGSFGNTPLQLEKKGQLVNKDKTQRYHIFAEGNFKHDDLNYGFNIQRTSSDKAYLKNYHQIFDSYLTSKVFVNRVDRKNYFALNGLYFQGLRNEDEDKKMPLVFPSFSYKNVIPIADDESANISIINNAMIYNESYIRQIGRNALEVIASKNMLTDSGQVINFSVSNRFDYYYTNIEERLQNENVEGKGQISNIEKMMLRNIPEISSTWRYPFISNISSKTSMKTEPIISVSIGRPYKEKYNKFGLVDSRNFDIREETLFLNNRFSGIDFHEYGKRLNYGVNTSLYSDLIYLNTFLGQAIHRNNVINKDNYEYVGSVSLDILNQIMITHKFRKDKNLSPIRDEIDFGYAHDRFTFNTYIVSLHNVARYFANDDFVSKSNKLKNITFSGTYNLTDGLSILASTAYDLSEKNKSKKLTRTIGVTYFKDCVRMTGKITDDFTHDSGRGVRKVRSQSFTIGLKVINM